MARHQPPLMPAPDVPEVPEASDALDTPEVPEVLDVLGGLPLVCPDEEVIQLRYRNTQQLVRTRRTTYLRGLNSQFSDWRLAGQAAWVAPPVCLSLLLGHSDQLRSDQYSPERPSHTPQTGQKEQLP